MISRINFRIQEFELMKNYPKELFYLGNTILLKKRKISIVGTRRPNSYTKELTYKIASYLSQKGFIIVSGAAMGVDALAHKAAGVDNTIAIMANGLNLRYPQINKKLIEEIEQKGLVLSTYKQDEKAKVYTFVQRNELVVALGEILIITQADLNSGSLRSLEYALKMNKKVYCLSHRIDESKGTQEYLKKGLIYPIYDLNDFYKELGINENDKEDKFLKELQECENLDDAILKFGNKVFEYELEEKIKIENGKIQVL